ncbi:MAG: hypothetical protein V1773_05830 [bacterium]
MRQKNNKILFWSPRVLNILYIGFIGMFSLDVFDGKYGFWETLLGFLIHNIPTMILIIILIISWKWPLMGAAFNFLAGVGLAFIIKSTIYVFAILLTPLIAVCLLYFADWYYNKREIITDKN